jgi:gliding motility-associated-like protein
LNLPQTPYGIGLNVGTSSVTLRWMPVVRFSDDSPFAVSTAAVPSELNGYHVYRATAPVLAPWTDVADVSSATLAWSDIAGDPHCGFQCFYSVAASNTLGTSAPSVVRSAADRSAYVIAPDGVSFLQVLSANVAPIEGVVGNPNSAYLVTASNRPQDLGALNGLVVKSIEFDAYQGGILLAPNLPMPGPGVLHMSYQTSAATGLVTPSAVAATPSNLSVYWNNGASWVQMYGTLDGVDQALTIQTTFVGEYQLRTVARAGAFSFNVAGISNRFLTPNGDHKNDNTVFTFDNPNGAAVTCRIFDMKGRLVASNLPSGPEAGNSLMWDGTSGGRTVPGGVYIYQMQAEGQTYSGTLVVIR